MEARHGSRSDKAGAVDVHTFVQAVVHNEVVGHADAVRFHGVALAVVIVANFSIVEVGHAAAAGGGG